MRIGIFTQPLCTNYGCILQNYALQTVLKSLGHEPVTLEKTLLLPHLPFWRQPLAIIKRFLLHTILRKKDVLVPLHEWRYNKEIPIITKYTRDFVSKHIDCRELASLSEVKKNDYDAFVVGSDQVWRPSYNYQSMQEMYLTFTLDWDVKRIAYAASLGTDKWELSPEDTFFYAPYVKKFDAVSVREDSSIDLVKDHFGVKAVRVLDPTMLLSCDTYASLAQTQPKSPGALMIHILDMTEEKQIVANRIGKDFNISPFMVNQEFPETALFEPIEKRLQPPVEKWLRGIIDAEVIFTDSFHACVFSILFNKPFIAFCNMERGASRFLSLLKMFGLERLLIFRKEDYTSALIQSIDFEEVNRRLIKYRETSINFLREALC